MRLGVVKMCQEYVVDLDNPEMVEIAKNIIVSDTYFMAKKDELHFLVSVTQGDYDESDIPDILYELLEDGKDE